MKIEKFNETTRPESGSQTEAPRGFFGKFGARAVAATTPAPKAVSAPQINTREALALLQNYEDSGQGWFWSTDSEGRLTYLSETISSFMGRSSNLIGTPLVDLFAHHGENAGQRSLPFTLAKQSKFDNMQLRAAVDSGECWWAVSGCPQFDGAGNFAGYRGNGTDVTARRESDEATSKLAMYDSLTGLSNRARISKTLDGTLNAFTTQKRPCALMLIDLDRFKQVNDTLGHQAGDELLKQVAKRLLKVVPDKERVGRIGGDEFQILLPNVDDRGVLGGMADDIINSLSQPYSVNGSRCVIGASIGIAINPYDGMTSEELIRNADLALYAAKGNGRGRFSFYSGELLKSAEDRRVLEHDLRDAMTHEQLWLSYQPIVDAKTNTVTGLEALIRWTHPEQGPISPAIFVPIAEDTNLIGTMGEWALRKACEEAAAWPGKLRVAVNVSAIQFADENLPRIVESALADSGLPPEQLELEITEGVFLGESSETDGMFAALKKIGVRLALDDFGTGYSSLGYLQTAPFDKIKIDQSFVRSATDPNSRNAAIISAIVALAKALDMETTAEGIETLDQLDLIRNLEVSHVQGYIYSQPVRNEELLEQIDSGGWTITPAGPAKQRHDRQSTFRKVGAIHENHWYPVVMRNISPSGALIEGLLDVPLDTRFVIDFGEGQLAVATVRRSKQTQQGLEFEDTLVSDGNGGLCTRHRVSPYLLAAAGLPTGSSNPGHVLAATDGKQEISLPSFTTVGDWNQN